MELISPYRDFGTTFNVLDIIVRIWFQIPSFILNGVMCAKFMLTSFIKHQNFSIISLPHGPSKCGAWISWGQFILSSTKYYWFVFVITNYFSKWIEATPLKKVKSSDVINFTKHTSLTVWCTQMDCSWQ